MAKKKDLKEALDSLFILDIGNKLKTTYFTLYEALLPYSPIDVKVDKTGLESNAVRGGDLIAELSLKNKIMNISILSVEEGIIFNKYKNFYNIRISPLMKKEKKFLKSKWADTGELEAMITTDFYYRNMPFDYDNVKLSDFFDSLSKKYNLNPKAVIQEIKVLTAIPDIIMKKCYQRAKEKKETEIVVKECFKNFNKGNLVFMYKIGEQEPFKRTFQRVDDETKADVIKSIFHLKSNKELNTWLTEKFPSLVEEVGRENYIKIIDKPPQS